MRTQIAFLFGLILHVTASAQVTEFQYFLGQEESGSYFTRDALDLSDGSFLVKLFQPESSGLLKMSNEGQVIWQKSYPGWNVKPIAGANGEFFLLKSWYPAGFEGVAGTSIAKVSPDGNFVWSNTYTFSMNHEWATEWPSLISAFHAGNSELDVFLHGNIGNAGDRFYFRIDGNGQLIRSKQCSTDVMGYSIMGTQGLLLRYTADGGMFTIMHYDEHNSGVITRWDPAGNDLWNVTVRMTNDNWAYDLVEPAITEQNEVYILGEQYASGEHHGFICKLAMDGSLLWYRLLMDGPTAHTFSGGGRVDQATGNVIFGQATHLVFNEQGQFLEGLDQGIGFYQSGPVVLTLSTQSTIASDGSYILTGRQYRYDETFNYTWTWPAVMKVNFDGSTACYLNSSTFTLSDTLVPMDFIEQGQIGNWSDVPGTISPVEATVTTLPIPTLTELCIATSIDPANLEQSSFEVYPTPVAQGQPVMVQSDRLMRIEVSDPLGRLVLARGGLEQQHQIATDRLVPGCYFIRAFAEDNTVMATRRFIVE